MLKNVEIPADTKIALDEILAQKIPGLETEEAVVRRALRFFLAHLHKAEEIKTDVGRPQLLPLPYAEAVRQAAQITKRPYRRRTVTETPTAAAAV